MEISSHDGIVISDYPLNILQIELNIDTKTIKYSTQKNDI